MARNPVYNFKQVLERAFKPLVNALRVCVVNTAADPVPVEIVVGATSSLVKHFAFDGDFTGGNPTAAISETVPVGKTWNLKKAVVTCRQALEFKVTVGGSTVASGRTGPAVLNRDFDWPDGYEVTAGTTVEIELTLLFGKPTSTCAESYLMVRET